MNKYEYKCVQNMDVATLLKEVNEEAKEGYRVMEMFFHNQMFIVFMEKDNTPPVVSSGYAYVHPDMEDYNVAGDGDEDKKPDPRKDTKTTT